MVKGVGKREIHGAADVSRAKPVQGKKGKSFMDVSKQVNKFVMAKAKSMLGAGRPPEFSETPPRAAKRVQKATAPVLKGRRG